MLYIFKGLFSNTAVQDKYSISKSISLLIAITGIGYAFTLPIDLIDIDTAQYAEISREMIRSGDYFHLRDNGKKYLDKPILTFWTIAIFFKSIGVSNLSFRIPALLALLFSCFGIYKIAEIKFKNQEISLLSVLAYLLVPGTYTYLLNPTIDIYLNTYLIFIFMFYYLSIYENNNYSYLMYFFLGLATITKGPIGIVIPAISIGGDIILRRDWSRIKQLKIFSGIPILLILPLGWSYFLYEDFQEFGPYFFLYLQSFGRFYMKIYDQGWNPSYFILTFLWMFLPFTPLFLYVVYSKIKEILQNKVIYNYIKNFDLHGDKALSNSDYVIELWLFLYLILISFSKYRLPQYVFWNIPAGVIFLSPYIHSLLTQERDRKIKILLFLPSYLSIALIFIIPFYVIDLSIQYFLVSIFLFVLLIYFYKYTSSKIALLILPFSFIFIITSIWIYPEFLKYQPSSKVAESIKELEPGKSTILSLGVPRSKRSYEFYSDRLIEFKLQPEELITILEKENTRLALLPEEFQPIISTFLKDKISYEVVDSYPYYKIATPKMSFINKHSRNRVLKNLLLVRLKLIPKE